MSNVPEGAQLSEDGQWWWDTSIEDWRSIAEEGDSAGAAGDERSQAKAAAGLPQYLEDLDDAQRQQVLGEPTASVEAVQVDETEVVAMQETNDNGEAVA